MKKKPKPADIRSWWERAPGLQFANDVRIRDYAKVRLRPITLQDEARMVRFHQGLSEESVYQRYFALMTLEERTRHERLLKICQNTDESFALVAVSGAKILGVGRLSRTDLAEAAEFALMVMDKAQGHGIGVALLQKIMEVARTCGFRQLTGEVLVANHDMQHVCRDFGFTLQTEPEEGVVRVTLQL